MYDLSLEELAYRTLPRVEAGRALAHLEWKTMSLVAEAVLHERGLDISADDVADNVERFLSAGRSQRAWRCRLLLHLVEALPRLSHGLPFSRLSDRERRDVVERQMATGRGIWGIAAKAKLLALMGAYGDDRASAATDYVPVVSRARFRSVLLRVSGARDARVAVPSRGRTQPVTQWRALS